MSDDTEVFEDDDQLEQLQPGDSLVEYDVDDVLDSGIISPDRWSPAIGYGNTLAEMRQGETIEQQLLQQEPEATMTSDEPWNPSGEPREVGRHRAGRLVDARGGLGGLDAGGEQIGQDVGIDGGAASAEEAAMHIIADSDDDE